MQKEPSEKCKHHMMGPKTCHHPRKKGEKEEKKGNKGKKNSMFCRISLF